MQTIYTDRITMTGSEKSYAIPEGSKQLVFHALSGDVTLNDTTGATDYVTIKRFGKLKLKGNFYGQTVYFTGTNNHIVEVLWTKSSGVDLVGGAIS
jgi:hypothetical protein